MKMFKLKVTKGPGHTYITVFSGVRNQTFANCGELVFDHDEAELFISRMTSGVPPSSVQIDRVTPASN